MTAGWRASRDARLCRRGWCWWPATWRSTICVSDSAAASCRAALHGVQRALLSRREEAPALLGRWAEQRGYSYQRLGAGGALEAGLAWLPWYFWQYQPASACARIPAEEEGLEASFGFLADFIYQGPLYWVSDQCIEKRDAYHIQRLTQTGHPRLPDSSVRELMQTDPSAEVAAYLPSGVNAVEFDAEAMKDIDRWVRLEGRRLIFVYGSEDPYTVGPFPLPAAESYRFVVEGANHDAELGRLREEERARAIELLEGWLTREAAAAR